MMPKYTELGRVESVDELHSWMKKYMREDPDTELWDVLQAMVVMRDPFKQKNTDRHRVRQVLQKLTIDNSNLKIQLVTIILMIDDCIVSLVDEKGITHS